MTNANTTSQTGSPIASDSHSRTTGADGVTALHDRYLVEKLAQFNRERIPEREVHAKGGGAFGEFVATGDVSAYTRAAVFQPGARTETAGVLHPRRDQVPGLDPRAVLRLLDDRRRRTRFHVAHRCRVRDSRDVSPPRPA